MDNISIPKPRQKKNGKWLVQVQVDGKRTSKEFETQEAALHWAYGMKIKALEEPREAKPKVPTLSAAFDQYIARRNNILSPATLRAYKNIRENYFDDLMSKPVDSITKDVIQQKINDLSVDKAHKTIKNAVALLLAVTADYTAVDMKRLTFPQREVKEHAFLEAPDIARLIDIIRNDPVEVPVLLALWLGLRRSEICALEWSDFDFENKTVSITKAKVPNSENKFIVKNRTKTSKSKRVLNVPDYVISRMEALQPDPSLRTGFITTMYPNDIYNHFKVVCDNNGIPFVGIHGLRHTNASVMLSIGVTAKMAMARGGWSSNKTMQDIYQHLFAEDKAAADTAINEYFEKLIAPGKPAPEPETE